ncbi:non-hydrolyzing UDP-N-acetylglucosamine 2-epimerase [Latilactobacillus fragifolii]|uniref:non-hydrolyzing UDP-N-acetylglucosamine 2-epimerase n=1 Tax=Latilactobacillus fragifolii TaxID=2814244 RepID=UPI001ABB3FEA|nr:UDP-N-acetylglucosamine 2-epimerase (non-hydrolyzing) [Latilactobacillus fragifolii]
MNKIKVMSIFGTRPEAIKMAPLAIELKNSKAFESIIVVTAQHREMLDQVLTAFKIVPDYDLNIMKKNQGLSAITNEVMHLLDDVIKQEVPDIILVHGDTTTTLAASLSAFYHQVTIGHVEAGLRTWQKYDPYPEEMNRQLTDILTDLYFVPTEQSKKNLFLEKHDSAHIFVTGNTAIDALKQTVTTNYHHEILDKLDSRKKMILVTMHRRENQGAPMKRVFNELRAIADRRTDIEFVFPVHLNPVIQTLSNEILGNHPRIHLIEPLNVIDFHNIAAQSYFIMTDSGGVQEEAPSLGKPVLVLRETTERPEGVEAGTLKLVGTHPDTIRAAVYELLDDEQLYREMATAKNPYGDGNASQRIANAIIDYFDTKNSINEV